MNSTRKIAITAGVVFIIATVAVLLADMFVPDLTGADYLTSLSVHARQVDAGALIFLIAYFASAGIAVLLYPVLKEWHGGLALGSVIFRTIEAAFYTVALVCLLSLLTLGQRFTAASATDQASLQAIGDLLLSLRQHAILAAVFAFSVGGFMYYSLFFQSRLIPRWLSGWGIAATVLMLTACVLALFNDKSVSGYIPLAAPIFLQEMVLGGWLIVKGFSPSAVASLSARAAASELLSAA